LCIRTLTKPMLPEPIARLLGAFYTILFLSVLKLAITALMAEL
jgi:hypothetical protein